MGTSDVEVSLSYHVCHSKKVQWYFHDETSLQPCDQSLFVSFYFLILSSLNLLVIE